MVQCIAPVRLSLVFCLHAFLYGVVQALLPGSGYCTIAQNALKVRYHSECELSSTQANSVVYSCLDGDVTYAWNRASDASISVTATSPVLLVIVCHNHGHNDNPLYVGGNSQGIFSLDGKTFGFDACRQVRMFQGELNDSLTCQS